MIKLDDVRILQQSIRAIANFISEGNFRFNDKGISFRAIDPSQIVLVDYNLPKELFKEFKVEPSFIGVDVEKFDKILKRALPNDTMELKLEESCILINFSGEMIRDFRLSLIEVNEADVKLPEHEFDATIKVSARILQEALKDAALFSSSIVFDVDKKDFSIEARGNNGTLKSSLKKIDVSSKRNVNTKFSLNFLENIVKEANPENTILLELKNEAPMRISYNIGKTSIKFYLAHMIL